MDIRLIVALGNPGKAYDHTYHNAGFLFVDYLQELPAIPSPLSKLTLRKTDVYMNQSGSSVKKMLEKSHIDPENLLIVHDDSDLPLGTYKIVFGRGSAGQKGVQDIMHMLTTKDFWRLRIGIRPIARGKEIAEENADLSAVLPAEVSTKAGASGTKASLSAVVSRAKAGDFVLKKISTKNLVVLQEAFSRATEDLIARLNSSSARKTQ